MTIKNVNEMSIDELATEHLSLRKRINARRERIQEKKPFTKKRTDKLLALCNELYAMDKIS